MMLFCDKGRKAKIGLLLAVMASGPIFGLFLGPRMGLFLRDLDWKQSTIPMSYMEVISASPKVFFLYDGYEVLQVVAPSEVRGLPISNGDKISGEITRETWKSEGLWGYRLLWARAHGYRKGKHLVSLIPLVCAVAWLAVRLRVREGLLEFVPERKASRAEKKGQVHHA